jgi:signal peptidase I
MELRSAEATGKWAPDPWRRAELRWFDGTNWTQHVSNAGVLSADFPVGPPPASSTSAPIGATPSGSTITDAGKGTTAPTSSSAVPVTAAAGSASLGGPAAVAKSPFGPRKWRAIRRRPRWQKLLVALLLLGMIGGWWSYTDGHVLAPAFGWTRYTMSGHSMDPTFHNGQSFWCEPLSLDEVVKLQPGSVIVVRDRPRHDRTLIKRVAGLGGDVLEARGGALYRNGTEEQAFIRLTGQNQLGDFEKVRIPEGSLFVLGDNFEGSADSRDFGPFRYQDVVCQVRT